MCGILGSTRTGVQQDIEALLDLINHRGPDSRGHKAFSIGGATVTLGHTRLAIQDLSASGHQPMLSADESWAVSFNGEIYNHLTLRESLATSFRGSSDTETLVNYLATHGIDKTLAAINGLFGFAALDLRRRKLYVVRDRFGIKPVYYHHDHQGLSFSSELKPVLAMTGVSGIDRDSLACLLQLRYVPSPATLMKDIERVRPGHYLTLDIESNALATVCYIRETTQRFSGSITDATNEYQRIMGDAVRRQLISDVPVGVLLSAGIDSAVIAAFAREHVQNLTAYTVGFGSQYPECELADAAETAQLLDIPHETVVAEPTRFIEDLPAIVDAMEEPLGTTSILPMWHLTHLARQSSTVVLAGQGNDEPWGGYKRYQAELLMDRWPILRNPALRPLSSLAGLTSRDALRRGLSCVGERDDARRFWHAYTLFDNAELQRLGGFTDRGQALGSINYWLQRTAATPGLSPAERMMRIDSRLNLADDLLLYGDKISMHYALEVRVPMLDNEVIEFVESLPLSYRAVVNETKVVHRRMAEAYLPARVINRPKKGFQVPFGEWCRTIWRESVSAYLLTPGLALHDHLDRTALEQVWQQHVSGQRNYERQLFTLLSLSLWLSRFTK